MPLLLFLSICLVGEQYHRKQCHLCLKMAQCCHLRILSFRCVSGAQCFPRFVRFGEGEGEGGGTDGVRCCSGHQRQHTRYAVLGAFWCTAFHADQVDPLVQLIATDQVWTYGSSWSACTIHCPGSSMSIRIKLIRILPTDQVDPRRTYRSTWSVLNLRIKLIRKFIQKCSTDQLDPWGSTYGSTWSVANSFYFKFLFFYLLLCLYCHFLFELFIRVEWNRILAFW